VFSFRRFAVLASLPIAFALAPAPARAHPHVWVDYLVTGIFAGKSLTALREEWHFDEDFSATVLHDILGEKAAGGHAAAAFSAAEIRTLHDKAFANLKDYHYFHHVWIDGRAQGAGRVHDFTARREGDRLVYAFTYDLAKPVDPAADHVEIGIWDDSYYVDVGPIEHRVAASLENPPAKACKIGIAPDKSRPIYFGSVFPPTIRIAC
jgi:ABC-type uncharacterized transport system substrate-binding protein